MAKEKPIVMQGEVTEVLPNVMFRVRLDNDIIILCTSCGNMKRNFIKVLQGDRVEVEMSVYDLTRGRITKRLTGSKFTETPENQERKRHGKK